MKVWIARFLLMVCIFSFTPLREMVKLPVLVVHYFHHRAEDSSMSIAEFFDMHYLQGIIYDEDYTQDMQLPFKTMDTGSMPVFMIVEMPLERLTIFCDPTRIVQPSLGYLFYVQDPRPHGIFHPPRVA